MFPGFVVGTKVTDQSKNENLPSTLRNVPFPPSKSGVDRSFKFERNNDKWQINGHSWSDGPEQRVLAKPQRGAIEVWELENSSGGWSHPIHIHLVDFQVISRTGGRGQVLPYEQSALKDVVWLNTNEKVRVIARYAPWDGLYMFHCKSLILH
jgi:bilirubin oxidase